MLTVRPARVNLPTDLSQVFNWNLGVVDAALCIDTMPIDVGDKLAGKIVYTNPREITDVNEIDRIAYYIKNCIKPMSAETILYCTGSVFSQPDGLPQSVRIKHLTNFLLYLNSVLTNDFSLPITTIRTSGLMGAENSWAKAAVFAKIPCCVTLPGTSVKRVYTIDVNGIEVGFDSVEAYRQYAGI